METGHDSDDLGHREKRALDALIRGAMDQSSDQTPWPSEEAILAYIDGSATASQYDAVQAALLGSPEFRREFEHIAAEVTGLSQPEAEHRFDAVSSREIPKGDTLGDRPFDRPHPRQPPRAIQRVREALTRSRWVQFGLAAPAAAMILVAVLVLMRGPTRYGAFPPGPPVAPLRPVHLDLSPQQFEPITLRGEEEREEIAEYTARDAALVSWRSIVTFEEGEFRWTHEVPAAAPESGAQAYSIWLVDANGRRLQSLAASILAPPAHVEAWFLTLPMLESFSVRVSSESLRVVWDADLPARGVVSLVHPRGDMYSATPAIPFELRSEP